MDGKIFESLIVDSALLSLREKAAAGDMKAMLQLIDHLLESDGARLDNDKAEALLKHVAEMEGIDEQPMRMLELLGLMVTHAEQLYRGDELNDEEYRECQTSLMADYIRWTTLLEQEEWDLISLRNCINWLIRDAEKLREEKEE